MAVITTGGKAAKGVSYVEYIESTGTQYIKLGVYHDKDTCPTLRMVIDMEIMDNAAASLNGCGSYQSYYVGVMSSTVYFATYYGDVATAVLYPEPRRMTYDLDNAANTFSLLSQTGDVLADATTTVGEPTGRKELYLCAYNASDAGEVGACNAQRTYSCRVYQSGTLVRDLRPCYDPDGVVCMYDRVSGEYLYNAGTGEFIAGVSV